jgi:hypothetical protein
MQGWTDEGPVSLKGLKIYGMSSNLFNVVLAIATGVLILLHADKRRFEYVHLNPLGRKSFDSDALEKAQALYDGNFSCQPEFWLSLCAPIDSKTSIPYPCMLLQKSEAGSAMQRREPEKGLNLTNWAPVSASDVATDASLSIYSGNETMALFQALNIKRIHVVGDSMNRYDGILNV